jgi:hypothetical protein
LFVVFFLGVGGGGGGAPPPPNPHIQPLPRQTPKSQRFADNEEEQLC